LCVASSQRKVDNLNVYAQQEVCEIIMSTNLTKSLFYELTFDKYHLSIDIEK